MDRIIALLAALVGLIALGGALLVNNSAEAVAQRQATEIAQLKASVAILGAQPVDATTILTARPEDAPTRPADDGTADALLALQNRIAALEELTKTQATELAEARTALASLPAGGASPIGVAALDAQPAQGPTASAITADGPTEDCIPLGTRFMAQSGDSFPICKTRAVVDVTAVNEGEAILEGPGSLVIGSTGQLSVPGCTIAVLSADASGFAEMRVTCV